MVDLDIYVERRSLFEKADFYTLKHLLPGLAKAGLSYRICDRFDPSGRAQTAFIHVDLTDLPPPFVCIHEAYPRCVNGRARTISRLLYSRLRLERDADHAGPVIVKTVLNHRGIPERQYEVSGSPGSRLSWDVRRLLIPRYKAKVCPRYEVFSSLAEVPEEVWSDRRLIVEKFAPGRIELPVIKNRYEFFFNIELNTRSTFNSLLCDPSTIESFDVINDVPASVMDVRRSLHLDSGAIDYFMVGGEALVIDANKTVTLTEEWVRDFPAVSRYVELATERLIEFVRRG